MSKEIDIKKECCETWNKLKDKTKMIDVLIKHKKQIAQFKAENKNLQQQLKDNTKQVCEKIRKFILNRRIEIKYNFTDYAKGRDSAFFEVKELLDQIDKGE